MSTETIQQSLASVEHVLRNSTQALPLCKPERLVEYFGVVNYATNERVIGSIKELLHASPREEICMIVTSAGGPTGTAMSFYDTVRSVLRTPLTTIGSGDVDSSGILIFLAGERRYVTAHTTLLLHLAGRTFDSSKRFTAREIEAMAAEDKIKDKQYASIVAEHSRGNLTQQRVLRMMERNTILTAEKLLQLGLADAILH